MFEYHIRKIHSVHETRLQKDIIEEMTKLLRLLLLLFFCLFFFLGGGGLVLVLICFFNM